MSKSTLKKEETGLATGAGVGAGAVGTGGIVSGVRDLTTKREKRLAVNYGYVKGKGSGHKVQAEKIKSLIETKGWKVDLINDASPKDLAKGFINKRKYSGRISTGWSGVGNFLGAGVPKLKTPQIDWDPKSKDMVMSSPSKVQKYSPDKAREVLRKNKINIGKDRKIITLGSGGFGSGVEEKVTAVLKHIKGRKDVDLVVPYGEANPKALLKLQKKNPHLKLLGNIPNKDYTALLGGSNVNIVYGGSSSVAEALASQNINVGYTTNKRLKSNPVIVKNFGYAKQNFGMENFAADEGKNFGKFLHKSLDEGNRKPYIESSKKFTREASKYKENFLKNIKINEKTPKLKGAGKILAGIGLVGLAAKFIKESSASKKDDLKVSGAIAGSALGLRYAEHAMHDIASKKFDFKDFKEVKKYYKDVKSGDVIFFKDSFSRGKAHPIVVTDTREISWPTPKNWEKGMRDKPGSPSKVRPFSTKGKIMEAYPGNTVVREKSLDMVLEEATHVSKDIKDPKTGKITQKRVFDPTKARHLGGIYRAEDLDSKKFNKNLKIIRKNIDKEKYDYSALKTKFDLAPKCGKRGKGTCITFVQSLVDSSRATPTNSVAMVPDSLTKNLKVIKMSKTPTMGRTNFLTPVLGLEGAHRIYKGIKNEDTKETAIGAAEVGVAAAINLKKNVNSGINAVGGFASQSVGGKISELPYKVLGTKGKSALSKFLAANPRTPKNIGALALGIPAIYGLHKGMDWISNSGKKRKKGMKKLSFVGETLVETHQIPSENVKAITLKRGLRKHKNIKMPKVHDQYLLSKAVEKLQSKTKMPFRLGTDYSFKGSYVQGRGAKSIYAGHEFGHALDHKTKPASFFGKRGLFGIGGNSKSNLKSEASASNHILSGLPKHLKRSKGPLLAHAYDTYAIGAEVNPKNNMIIFDYPSKAIEEKMRVRGKVYEGFKSAKTPEVTLAPFDWHTDLKSKLKTKAYDRKEALKTKNFLKAESVAVKENRKTLVKNLGKLDNLDKKVVGTEVLKYIKENKKLFGRDVARGIIDEVKGIRDEVNAAGKFNIGKKVNTTGKFSIGKLKKIIKLR